jgi:hypothetical protein
MQLPLWFRVGRKVSVGTDGYEGLGCQNQADDWT